MTISASWDGEGLGRKILPQHHARRTPSPARTALGLAPFDTDRGPLSAGGGFIDADGGIIDVGGDLSNAEGGLSNASR